MAVPRNREAFAEIITQSKTMAAIFRYVEAVAPSPQPVLVTGETGAGKELIARALHRLSGRTGEFVAVNVAGLDDGQRGGVGRYRVRRYAIRSRQRGVHRR